MLIKRQISIVRFRSLHILTLQYEYMYMQMDGLVNYSILQVFFTTRFYYRTPHFTLFTSLLRVHPSSMLLILRLLSGLHCISYLWNASTFVAITFKNSTWCFTTFLYQSSSALLPISFERPRIISHLCFWWKPYSGMTLVVNPDSLENIFYCTTS